MSLNSILRLIEDYIRKNPTPAGTETYMGMLKLIYQQTSPATNSKSKKQLFYPIEPLTQNSFLQPQTQTLTFDQKTNKLSFANHFDSISTQEVHDKVIQDHIFGSAKLNKNKDKWIYAAKKKVIKAKSYFLGGSGKSVHDPDLGQLYDDVSEIGIYIWDLTKKKIVPVDIKIEEEQDIRYVFSYPIFGNDEGSKFICHGYKKMEFGYGIAHCFNRAADIFEVQIQNIGEENAKVKSRKLIQKHETNIFANISPCYNYIIYFGGQDYIHSFYFDIVVIKRNKQNNYNHDAGYTPQWTQTHRFKHAFLGNYQIIKTQTFNREGVSYAYFQTQLKGNPEIKCLNLETGQMSSVSENKLGEAYKITNFDRNQQLLSGIYVKHNATGFFYCKFGEKPILIPPTSEEQFTIEQFKDPIHSYYIESKNVEEQFKKEKKPLIVLAHGGPHCHGEPGLTLLRHVLLKCGYGILLPNFSGSRGFGQQFIKSAQGNIGTTDAQQIIKSIENLLKSKNYLDSERVYIHGGSYGGYMGAIMGTRYPQYFKAAIILNGVISIPGNLWFSDTPQWSTAQTLKQAKIHNLRASDYVKMYEQSPITLPMKIPTLQFLGAKDRRVPYRQGLLFDAMTKKAGTPIQTFVYGNAGHSLADSVDTSIDLVVKTLLFLEEIPFTETNVTKKTTENKQEKIQSENGSKPEIERLKSEFPQK